MLSRAHYGAPSLQLDIHRPPRRPHGVGVENEGASWAPKKFWKNQRASLVTPGDSRAAVVAKESCPQPAKGVAVKIPPLCSNSLGGGVTSFQDHPA